MTRYAKWTKLNLSGDKDKDQPVVVLTTECMPIGTAPLDAV